MAYEKKEWVYCPNCGNPLINFAGTTLIAIHEQKNIHKEETANKEVDIRRYMEERGYEFKF